MAAHGVPQTCWLGHRTGRKVGRQVRCGSRGRLNLGRGQGRRLLGDRAGNLKDGGTTGLAEGLALIDGLTTLGAEHQLPPRDTTTAGTGDKHTA